MANQSVMTFGDENFQKEVLESKVPVLVDFWAPWCAPCRMIAPAIEQLAGQFEGKAKIGKMNIDEHAVVPQKYGVMSIPTVLVFKDGKVVGAHTGTAPKAHFEDLIKNAL